MTGKAAFGAGVIGCGAVAIADFALAVPGGDTGAFGALVFVLGLWAPLIVATGAASALIARAVSDVLGGAIERFLLALAGVGAASALLAFALRGLGAGGAPIVVFGGAAGGALGFRVSRVVPRVSPWIVRGLGVLLPPLAWGFFALFDLEPPRLAFAAACVVAALALASTLPARFLAALGRKVGVGAVVVVAALLAGATFAKFGAQDGGAETVNRHAPFASRLVGVYQSLVDQDGDGFSPVLGGGDCDDSDPKVGPTECALRSSSAPRADRRDATLGRPEPSMPGDASRTFSDAPRVAPPSIPAPASTPAPAAPNIVLLTVDALRADHLGCYGYRRPTSPAIDRFARDEAILFTWAFAPDTKTKPSIPALFAGRYASKLAWTKPRYVPLRDGNALIAERLRARGYHTAGFVTHTYFAKYNRMNQGFDAWDATLVSPDDDVAFGRPTAHILTDRILAYLGNGKRPSRPIFLWAHYFDPHQKYLAHRDFAAFGNRAIDRYDQEVAFTDLHIGRLIDGLKRVLDWGRTVVVLTADHGEAFGEHGFRFHGESLHNEQLRVPLLLRVPGVPARVVDHPVSLIDIAPTVMEIVAPSQAGGVGGAKGESALTFDGVSLMREAARAPFLAELLPENHIQSVKALIDGRYKLIYYEARNRFELFDYVSDAAEKRNLVKREPERFAKMRDVLLREAATLPKWQEMGDQQ